MKKIAIFVLPIILVIGAICYFLFQKQAVKLYTKDLFYMDTYISIKLYSNSKEKANLVLQEVEDIYREYHDLTNRYDKNSPMYYIHHNEDTSSTITIPDKLSQLLQYGKEWYEKSNHLLNINMGNVIDIWKHYRDTKTGVPTLEELKQSGSTSMKDLKFSGNGTIENTRPNLDLGALAKGYVTELVGKHLEEKGFPYYLINAGGNVLVGEHYNHEKYKIGIQNPDKNGGILLTLKATHMAVVTSGGYERNYEYNGVLYHHILDPNTLFPPNYMKSVTIITPSSSDADALSTTLFLMTVEEGQEYLKQYPNVDAIWVKNDGQMIKTEGVKNYE